MLSVLKYINIVKTLEIPKSTLYLKRGKKFSINVNVILFTVLFLTLIGSLHWKTKGRLCMRRNGFQEHERYNDCQEVSVVACISLVSNITVTKRKFPI